MSLRRRIALLFGGAIVLVALVGAGAVYSVLQVTRARSELVSRAQPARLASAELVRSLADQETGLRGYALSRDQAFLEPYASGRASEAALLARLARLTRHDPEATARLDEVRRRVDTWRTQYALLTIQEVRDNRPGFDSRATLTTSKKLFDGIRAAIGRLDASLVQREAAASSNLDRTTRRMVGLFGAGLVLFVVMGLVILVSLRRLVTDPLEALGHDARLVVGGDLDHEIRRSGPTELVQLATDVDDMRRRIVAELDSVSAARAELDARNVELTRSNLELEQFAYVASHDLQEPLRKVVSFTQLLQQRYAGQLDERADEYIEFAADGARRMQVLINDLLAFSRVGRSTESFGDVDLVECVRTAERNLSEALAEAGAQVRFGALPVVRGDQTLLTAVFQNLISNAVKFRGEEPPVVDIEATEAEGLWWISVTDNGIGIEPRFAERVFVIFQRLHPRTEYDGTGIGLALSRKVVEHHGGALWLDTDQPQGARFCFTLPSMTSVATS